jgi:DNA-binding CsgD family transcriptional regulator
VSALTARERECLGLVAIGCTNTQICARLGIALGTVKSHMESIFAKLQVTSREEAGAAYRESQT